MTEADRRTALGLVQPLIDRLVSKPEVAAVALLSNAALPAGRTWFDRSSDLDLSVLVRVADWDRTDWAAVPSTALARCGDLPRWLPNFLFHVQAPWGPVEVNVNQLALEYERDERTVWDDDKCDVYTAKCSILHDPHRELHTLVEEKSRIARRAFAARIRRLAYRLTWDVDRVPTVALGRVGPPAAHHLLNLAIDEYIELVYLLHGRFRAAAKWRLVTLAQDDLLAPPELGLLYGALRCDGTGSDVLRRTELLRTLWDRLVAEFDLGSIEEIRHRYLSTDVQLRSVTAADREATADEFARANFELRSAGSSELDAEVDAVANATARASAE